MDNFKRYLIRIPNNASVVLVRKTLFVLGPLGINSFKVPTKLSFFSNNNNENFLYVTRKPFSKISFNEKKRMKSFQGTSTTVIKQLIKGVTIGVLKKLKLVGIGYRVVKKTKKNLDILFLKLGYSHDIYYKIPKHISVECPKPNLIYLLGSNVQELTVLTSALRSLKKPEPYKGKGILYDNEKIVLKEGKKT